MIAHFGIVTDLDVAGCGATGFVFGIAGGLILSVNVGDGTAGSLIGSGKPANSGCDSGNLIVNDCWHLAHLARFPSFSLATLNDVPQLGHEIDSFILQLHGVNIELNNNDRNEWLCEIGLSCPPAGKSQFCLDR